MIYSALEATDRLIGFEKAAEAVLNQDETRTDIDAIKEAARTQQVAGFPAVYGLVVIVTWSAIETLLRDTVKAWLSGPTVCWTGTGLIRGAVDLERYEARKDAGTAGEHLFEIADRTARDVGPRGAPFDRWKWLLKKLSVSPRDVEREHLDAVRELSLVRNLLAHSPGGVVDEKFWNAWPERWSKRCPAISVGSILNVDMLASLKYVIAAIKFGRGVERAVNARLDELAVNLKPRRPGPSRVGLAERLLALGATTDDPCETA